MAEQNTNSPRKSLYMHSAIQQVSADDGAVNKRQSPISPDLPMISTFGQEFRLMCPVCLQDLKQPKQLKSCYHIFCKDCLQPFLEKAEDEKVTCPLATCNRSCLKEDISRALSSDTYLHAFPGLISVYAESGDVSCSDVSHGQDAVPATFFCLECGHNLCEGCYCNHSGNEEFKHHHYLKLFKTRVTMTVGVNRVRESPSMRSVDQLDLGSSYKCPICRNTDTCEHENWLKDLWDENFRTNDECQIPDHAEGNKLIAYCTECEEPICRNCSMIEHKAHDVQDIGKAMKNKIPELQSIKKMLGFQQEMFYDAAETCDRAEAAFKNHVLQVEQEMIGRKGSMQTQVEEAFNIAFNLIEQTGRKQSELNRQGEEMHAEDQFLKTAIQLAENVLVEGTASIEVVRVWKGLSLILEDLGGEKKKSKDPEVVIPQDIVEKRLVLPAPSCMNPDLCILQKVGVENTILRQAFVLKAEDELLLFYSILPLTEMEALVSCKTEACATSVVQYSNVESKHYSVRMRDEGQYSIIAVPGNGIVATLYQAPGSCSGGDSKGKKQVLFWDQALGISMTKLEAQGAGDRLKMFAETDLPPRGVAVTMDNHLVVCTARDPPKDANGDPGECLILLMTMRGDILRERHLKSTSAGPSVGHYFPRYVTVNINGDICVTDEKDHSVRIFSDRLDPKHRITNPYGKDELDDKFSPRGICHDSFGRLIVADPNNNAVLRIEYSDDILASPPPQVILKDRLNGAVDLSSPTLVAMGPGPRLWVVCRNNIQVFDYMDKE